MNDRDPHLVLRRVLEGLQAGVLCVVQSAPRLWSLRRRAAGLGPWTGLTTGLTLALLLDAVGGVPRRARSDRRPAAAILMSQRWIVRGSSGWQDPVQLSRRV